MTGCWPHAEHNKTDNCESEVDHSVNGAHVKRRYYDAGDPTRNNPDGVQDYRHPNRRISYEVVYKGRSKSRPTDLHKAAKD